jgi:hypothetical protein
MRFDMNVLLYAALEGLRSYSYSADRIISVVVFKLTACLTNRTNNINTTITLLIITLIITLTTH